MKRAKLAFFLALIPVTLLLVSSCMSFGFGAPRGAVFLGERSVGIRASHDAIMVGRYEGSFSALVFKVENNDIELFDIVVTYADGQRDRLDTRLVFAAETRSRAIDLDGSSRRISSIEFSFRTIGRWSRERARVLVYGLRSAPVSQISIEMHSESR
jgi:hypothetical protein